MRKTLHSLLLALLLAASLPGAGPARWTPLFDGRSLNGWTTEGRADWKVKNGAIVGRQGPNLAGGDLYTQREWTDFELEAEFKLNNPANSGIWFRNAPERAVFQVDLLDEPQHRDSLSGSLYIEGKGFLAKNSDAGTIHRNGWNHIRLVVVGNDVTIAMNGKIVVRVQVHDDRFLKPGRIGFQVHGGEWVPNMEVRIRKIRIRDLGS